jgi:hypothetical protein
MRSTMLLDRVRSPIEGALDPRKTRDPNQCSSGWLFFGLGIAVTLGFIVRAYHVLSHDFPLNDGGLFYVMVQELQRSNYQLPNFTAYNFARIPFAYPPLGLYVAGAMADLTRISLIDLFRFIPLAISTLTIAAFFLLARSLLISKAAVIAAVFAFALIPRSFIWLLMGGGVTRSFGLLFTILTLHQVHKLYTRQQWKFVLPATIYAALTVVSHIGTAPFLAFSIGLFFVAHGRHKHGVMTSIAVGIGTLVLSAPWWASIVGSHGIEPFLAAHASGSSIFSDSEARRATLGWLAHLGVGSSSGGTTAEPLFPLLGTLAFLGGLYAVSRNMFFLPVWWLTIIVLDTRAGATYAIIPVAMLTGIGLTHVLLPALVGGWTDGAPLVKMKSLVDDGRSLGASLHLVLRRQWFPVLLFGFILCYAMLGALSTRLTPAAETRNLASLSKEERAAMYWVAESTTPSSRFLVLPENEWNGWWVNKTSEWFPVLAERPSVATVQGYEWLPDKAFAKQRNNFKLLKKCAGGTVQCLDDWSRQTGIPFTHVYIPQPTLPAEESYFLCCQVLITTLRDDPRYDLLYSGPGAVVFARR